MQINIITLSWEEASTLLSKSKSNGVINGVLKLIYQWNLLVPNLEPTSLSTSKMPWTNYSNPKPDLADVEIDGKTYAIAEAHLLRENHVKFVHSADLMYPVIWVIEKLLERDEKLSVIDEIKLLSPIKNEVKIYAQDISAWTKFNFKKDKISAKGFVTTSNWRRIEFFVIENPSSPIQEIRSANLFSTMLYEKRVEKEENRYSFWLNPEISENFFRWFSRSYPVQISTIIDILVKQSSTFNMIDSSNGYSFGYVQRIKNLPGKIDFDSLVKNGAQIEIFVNMAKRRKMPSWMFVIPLEFSFPWQSEPTLIYAAITESLDIFDKAQE